MHDAAYRVVVPAVPSGKVAEKMALTNMNGHDELVI
jgi:hypothetical protein